MRARDRELDGHGAVRVLLQEALIEAAARLGLPSGGLRRDIHGQPNHLDNSAAVLASSTENRS